MKKALVFAAALALAATPAAAQQAAPSQAPVQAASVVAPSAAAPSIWVSQEEIRQRVAAAEAERETAQMGNNFWYTVLAVALGVIVAALLLD